MIFQEVPLNVVLTIYSEDIDEDYIYGKIVMRNEEEVIIAQINDKGESDGYLYLQWEGIYRIDYESSYEEKIERLYQAKNQYHEELMFPKKEDTLLKNLLNQLSSLFSRSLGGYSISYSSLKFSIPLIFSLLNTHFLIR